MPFAFDALKGLEHVHNIGLDPYQAMYMKLRMVYKVSSQPDSSNDNETPPTTPMKEVGLIFMITCPVTKGGDNQHVIRKYFAHIRIISGSFHSHLNRETWLSHGLVAACSHQSNSSCNQVVIFNQWRGAKSCGATHEI